MADAKAMKLTVLTCYTELVKECGRCLPHYAKVVTVVLLMYNVYAPLPPHPFKGHLPMVINWTPTTGFIPCQVHPGHANDPGSPSADKSHRRSRMTRC